MQLLAKEDIHAREIAEVVAMDAVFTAELLSFANSPLFGCCQRVTNLRHAMVLVGRERLRGLILTAALRGVMKGVPLDRELFRTWWRHSLATGLLTEGLAAACSVYCPQGYAAGLLHDMGRLGLMVNVSRKDYLVFLQDVLTSEETTLEVERNHFGLEHCQIAGYLASNWSLPEELILAGERHHEELDFEPSLPSFVRESCRVASAVGFSTVRRPGPPPISGIWANLSLDPSTLREALDRRLLTIER